MQLSARSGRTAVDGTHGLAGITVVTAGAAAARWYPLSGKLIGRTALCHLGNGDRGTRTATRHPPRAVKDQTLLPYEPWRLPGPPARLQRSRAGHQAGTLPSQARSGKSQPRIKPCQPAHSHSANSAHRPAG